MLSLSSSQHIGADQTGGFNAWLSFHLISTSATTFNHSMIEQDITIKILLSVYPIKMFYENLEFDE